MRRSSLLSAVAIVAAAAMPPVAAATSNPDAQPGARLYQARCGACHSLDANRIGPAHRGVYGRRAGSAPNYGYSEALKASAIVWNDQTLNQWLQGPQKMAKGTRMYYALADPAERRAIIAYLKATSGK